MHNKKTETMTLVSAGFLLDVEGLENIAEANRAVNHPLRMRMLHYIGSKELTVMDIWIGLRLEQSVASQHLAILKKAGIVHNERKGKFNYYSINTESVNALNKRVQGYGCSE